MASLRKRTRDRRMLSYVDACCRAPVRLIGARRHQHALREPYVHAGALLLSVALLRVHQCAQPEDPLTLHPDRAGMVLLR